MRVVRGRSGRFLLLLHPPFIGTVAQTNHQLQFFAHLSHLPRPLPPLKPLLNRRWLFKRLVQPSPSYPSHHPHPHPTPGWLFKKLYGRLPSESDKAVMTDPDLGTEFRFDVNFIGAANVHYITVGVGGWVGVRVGG